MTEKTPSYILSMNCGSSSLKFSLYHAGSLQPECSGSANAIGSGKSELLIKSGDRVIEQQNGKYQNLGQAVKAVIRWLKNNSYDQAIVAIGHRLVQGGPEHRGPELITSELLKSLHELIYLAPNHLPDEIKTILSFQSAFPGIPQVACFDTAIHRNMPNEAKYYALPARYREQGLMHYGFHGLSYEYILQKLRQEDAAIKNKKIIIAHLGNGASMAAIKNGVSIETTMGLTPMGGLVMSSRSGDLDPGVLLFLLKQGKLTPTRLDKLLSKDAGLKAIAGIGDVQELLNREATDADAKAALTLFCYQAKKYIGALAAAMGGLDMLVFTGGIGQHSAAIRQRICHDLEFLGLVVHQPSNLQHHDIISDRTARVMIKVLATDEEAMIAHHTKHLTYHNN